MTSHSSPLPTRIQIKARVRRLRLQSGNTLSQSQALEQVAHDAGFRDWNTLSAALGKSDVPHVRVGQNLTGRYLGHPFSATVLRADAVEPGWTRLELDLDTAIDVVRFDSFSAMRKRIRGTIGPRGTSREATSDGVPHLSIDLE